MSSLPLSLTFCPCFVLYECVLNSTVKLRINTFLSVSLSLSVVSHHIFLISGISLRFEDVDVFFLQHIHYPVNPSSDHFHTDAVVPSSDHCHTETVSTSGDHYCIEIAPRVPVLESNVMSGPEKNQVTWSMEPYCVLGY